MGLSKSLNERLGCISKGREGEHFGENPWMDGKKERAIQLKVFQKCKKEHGKWKREHLHPVHSGVVFMEGIRVPEVGHCRVFLSRGGGKSKTKRA